MGYLLLKYFGEDCEIKCVSCRKTTCADSLDKKLKALVRFGGELKPCTLIVNIFREDIAGYQQDLVKRLLSF